MAVVDTLAAAIVAAVVVVVVVVEEAVVVAIVVEADIEVGNLDEAVLAFED